MPDRYGFDHLPNRGMTEHRCIEEGCGYPGFGITLSEAERARHARQHERDRKRELERTREENLRRGRMLARQAKREDELVRARRSS